MLDMIATAHGIDRLTILGGPSWLERRRFDITAKVPASTPSEALQGMLRSPLVDRFKLSVHLETRPLPATILTTSGDPRLKVSSTEERGLCLPVTPAAPPASAPPLTSIACRGVTMESFAQQLRQFGGGHIDGRVVARPACWAAGT